MYKIAALMFAAVSAWAVPQIPNQGSMMIQDVRITSATLISPQCSSCPYQGSQDILDIRVLGYQLIPSSSVAYTNKSNTFTSSQTIIGSLFVTSSVTAGAFFGNGAGLTNLPSTTFLGGTVPNETDFMSSVTFHSSVTVDGSFDVGGLNFIVQGGSVAIGTPIDPGATLHIEGNVVQAGSFDFPEGWDLGNTSAGTSAAATISFENDVGDQMLFGLTSSNNNLAPNSASKGIIVVGNTLIFISTFQAVSINGSIISTGDITANQFHGNGALLTGLPSATFLGGTVPNETDFLSSVTFHSSVTAGNFIGDGSGLTNLPSTPFLGGTVPNETDFLSSVTFHDVIQVSTVDVTGEIDFPFTTLHDFDAFYNSQKNFGIDGFQLLYPGFGYNMLSGPEVSLYPKGLSASSSTTSDFTRGGQIDLVGCDPILDPDCLNLATAGLSEEAMTNLSPLFGGGQSAGQNSSQYSLSVFAAPGRYLDYQIFMTVDAVAGTPFIPVDISTEATIIDAAPGGILKLDPSGGTIQMGSGAAPVTVIIHDNLVIGVAPVIWYFCSGGASNTLLARGNINAALCPGGSWIATDISSN